MIKVIKGQQDFLQNINLDIAAHTIVGLAGPSGSGKSTLLRCLQGFDGFTKGEVQISDNTAFMFQDFQLFPHWTVLENIVYAPRLHQSNPHINQKAMQLLTDLGLADKSQMKPSKLSGGQKQRVALARCLMTEPDILFCDEPTSGLDVVSIDEVAALLQKVQARGVTMVIASHDLTFLSQIADRIIVLNQGRQVADFAPKTIGESIEDWKKYYLAN